MKSQDYARSYSHSWIHKLTRNKGHNLLFYNLTLVLVIQTIVLPCSVAFQTQTALAQNAIAQSPSLNKTKNIIHVNPQSGDDSQVGKKLSPVKTITHALEIAPTGSTIQLASGTYSEETGEKFPLLLSNQVSLQGNLRNQGYTTIIKGSGYFISPTAAGQHVTIAATKNASSVTGITITNDHSRGYGLWIESASPQIISNTFTRNGNTGVSVSGKSAPKIEDNYFYNNSGNGLLVDGTSKPEVVDNTFEQTGFGVSLLQQAAASLNNNSFKSNRIGIILEGNSQAVLRDNEIINSREVGLMAIAKSRVDLGTDNEPGNNIFRSNRKLDIHNATSNQIPAVKTQVQGKTVGEINFERGTFVANTTEDNTFRDLPPLPSRRNISRRPLPKLNVPAPTTPTETVSNLPAPPPVLESSNSGQKELVFRASSSSAPVSPDVKPVPFPPEISGTALSSRASQVKYKVLVETLNQDEENEVRSLYPEAFKTVFQGEPWLQIGAFSNWDKAKRAERTLVNLGLETYLID
ncbi:MAG: DUF1565 domain-containing protein [Cyanobacteria bacterium P01_A01_bin.40]